MSLILCIETSTTVCSVALCRNGNVLAIKESNDGYTHAASITLFIQQVMHQSGYVLADIDAVAVSMGPGSYTGLRVGVSTAKGLCYALQKPLLAVNTLKALATHFTHSHQFEHNSLLIPMIDARRMEVYTATFNTQLDLMVPTHALIVDENTFAHTTQFTHLFGNGAAKCAHVLKHPLIHIHDNVVCSASGLCKAAFERYEQQQFEDVAYFEPYYLKDFVGTTPKNKIT
jgi:tRNA threonylcarbamoyladenosine biosynthesis protein TsaB